MADVEVLKKGLLDRNEQYDFIIKNANTIYELNEILKVMIEDYNKIFSITDREKEDY